MRRSPALCRPDASKGMIARAKENIKESGLEDKYVRFIAEDCMKFVEREIRRGRKYDGIIMDPPSYGRGPKGELWKLEDSFYDLVSLTSDVIPDVIATVRNITTAFPDASSEIYDLQGRRLSAIPQKGVYIQNGKKIIVK